MNQRQNGFVCATDVISAIESDSGSGDEILVMHTTRSNRINLGHSQDVDESELNEDEDDVYGEDTTRQSGFHLNLRNGNSIPDSSTRSVGRSAELVDLDQSEKDLSGSNISQSSLPITRWARRRGRRRDDLECLMAKNRHRAGERKSGRSTRHRGVMQEIEINDTYRSDTTDTKAFSKPKAIGARETFKQLPFNNEFRMRHMQQCEVCREGQDYAPLIFCQGCVLAYHKICLGHRANRDHLVTKVGHENFVLQCRRCVAYIKKKHPTAPDQGKCSECKQYGNACQPFRLRKTAAQEQKDRDDNGGEDPVFAVNSSCINNPENVLFRCLGCWRAFHFHHLPSRSDMMNLDFADVEQRFREYSRDWKCKDCATAPARVSALIAWKPVEEDKYDPSLSFENTEEDQKAYLIKWDGMSYFRAQWMPGAWVWAVTPHMMRKAFAKRSESFRPKMRTEDAIPEEFLRTDIVLDIKFTSIADFQTEDIDKAQIREIDKALIKYKGLGYEDAVWEAPPCPEDGERWTDFVTAYNDWVAGRYVRQPAQNKLEKNLEQVRLQNFSSLEKKLQPKYIEGGELMRYQIEGINWLYYKWFTQRNAILADEMGLGKTVQIIGFLAVLIQEHSCWPFLIVVPNSTCPNWRREIKHWAPSLRVVTYYGSKESRDLAYRYELFPRGSKDLRCHVVITSYDAAADENFSKLFRVVSWQGLIVDEGQRLKSDKTLLYNALAALKTPFRILLTGTPLQNNQRELFNLLHFLDDSFNSEDLEKQYEDLTQEKITELHNMIRPLFLRRTKAQVLSFLPPMAQVIVPVSMTLVQKKLYRTILAKNPELMKAIFSADTDGAQRPERTSLSNILMQLRKCLCHPFVYNRGIEERNVTHAASHRNLVDAAAKLKFLELLLPKLKERGHRVLIFSQFLDMLEILEDFLDGMAMAYQRLDGTINALQKQKRIDEFNAPNSPFFAFLLSTRAGGVGINLASADTVIILDPDFNPHQDIQAIARAHRIGQSKKVLCFQLVTRASVEERIVQIGRKKLALDHVLIQEMDADDADQNDLVSVLRHGASELFQDSGNQDITYDSASIERLLDRSQVEDKSSGKEKSAETQFSFARVWTNDTLQDNVLDVAEETASDSGVWANILKERERIAAEEAAAKAEALGRGRRARGNVDYLAGHQQKEHAENVDVKSAVRKIRKEGGESDTDFQVDDSSKDHIYSFLRDSVADALMPWQLKTTTHAPMKTKACLNLKRQMIWVLLLKVLQV